MLHLLESNVIFVREVGQVDLRRKLQDLHEEVKSKEATHQGHENGDLWERFSLLQKALRDVLTNRADADLRERFSLPQKAMRDALINRANADIGRERKLSMQAAAARAEVGLDPSASDAELAAVQAYIATPGVSEMKAWLLHIASVHEVTVGWCLDLLLG